MKWEKVENVHLRFATSWASWQLRYLSGIEAWIQQFIQAAKNKVRFITHNCQPG